MNKVIKVKKGLDIPLMGMVEETSIAERQAGRIGISPEDYPGYTWKVAVKAGDIVKRGDAILYAKEDERVSLTSPVAGEIDTVARGARRRIEYVSIKASTSQEQRDFGEMNTTAEREEMLMRSGLFALIRQRPFDIVPFSGIRPRDIFVTAFDTAPLASDMLRGVDLKDLESGLKYLKEMTDGEVYLSVKGGSSIESNFAQVVEFAGPHPAGLVGTQIAAISPINKGEYVWTLDAVTAARIGKFFTTKILDFSTIVALTGEDIAKPKLVKTTIGAELSTLLKGEIKAGESKKRVISGNVLTGKQVDPEAGFLGIPYRQITVIDEGDQADEFMGWASLNPKKYSVSRTFPAFIFGLKKPYYFDSRIKGGHRAVIMTGEYDKVFPMDIYVEYLIKAIIAKDIDKMEQLGIYEVAPEDFALAEFVDTSKLELQKIVREGLDYLRKETI